MGLSISRYSDAWVFATQHSPNICIRILLQFMECGNDLALNHLLSSSVVLKDRGQDFERLCHVETDVGDLVIA